MRSIVPRAFVASAPAHHRRYDTLMSSFRVDSDSR